MRVRAPRESDIHSGDRVEATGLLRSPPIIDGFSYRDFLARRGIYSWMPEASVEVIARTDSAPLAALGKIRAHLSAFIGQMLSEPHAALLQGILLGEDRLSPAIEEAYARTGAAHLIAISGFNMSIVGMTTLTVLNHTRLNGRAAGALAIVLIVLYAIFVGGEPSVLRAAVMTALLIIASLLRRQTYVPASLAFVTFAFSLVNPFVLWDIGFQLSFAATLGIALFQPRIRRWIHRIAARLRGTADRAIIPAVEDALAVTFAAQALTLPLIALYFERISLIAPVVNLLVVPLQPLVLFTGAFALVGALAFPALSTPLMWLAFVPLQLTNGVVRAFAEIPTAALEFPVRPSAVTAFFLAVGGWSIVTATHPEWLEGIARRLRPLTTVLLLSGVSVLVLTGATLSSRPDGLLHVWLLDMGRGNAVFAQTPAGAQILIDGGSFPSRLLTALGDRMPFYDREIDLLAITQPDETDFAALLDVAERYRIGAAITHGQPNLGQAYQTLRERLSASLAPPATAGQTIQLSDGVFIEVLHPAAPPGINDRLDDVLLVLRMRYGEVSFLFTGDLSPAGQESLLARGLPASSVLQLPRHGQRGSLTEAFYHAAAAQIVIVASAGRGMGIEPDPDVLQQVEVPLLRTDAGGTIHLWTDGITLWHSQEG